MLDAPRATSLVQKVGDHGGLGEDSVTHSPTKKASINSSRWYGIKIKNRGEMKNNRNEQASSRPEVPIVISSSSPKGNSAEARDDDDVALNRKSDERKNAVDDNNTLSGSIPQSIPVSVSTDLSFEDYSMYLSDSDNSNSDSDSSITINDFFVIRDEGRNSIDNSSPNRDEALWISLANVVCSSLSFDEFDARDMAILCETLEEDIRVDEFEAREIALYFVKNVHQFKNLSARDYADDATKQRYDGVSASSIVSLLPYVMHMRKSSTPIPREIWQNEPLVKCCDNIKAKTTEVVPRVVDAKQEDTRLVTTAEAPQVVAANQKDMKLPTTNTTIDRVVDDNPILKVIRKKESSVQSVTGDRSSKSVRKSLLRVISMLRKKIEASVKCNTVTAIDPVEIAEMDDIQDSSDEIRDDFHTLPSQTDQNANGEENRDNNGDVVDIVINGTI